MKRLKKLFIILSLIGLAGCGFSPMLKNVDMDNINITNIQYSGNDEMIYLLKNKINLEKSKRLKEGYTIKINIIKNVSSATKNTSGVTTQEQITVIVNLSILNSKGIEINYDQIEDSRVIDVTNVITTDSETSRTAIDNLITNISRKLIFSIKANILQDQK
jgi:outer membrane lipopolysaccharide assembly protein LptE/RlpB